MIIYDTFIRNIKIYPYGIIESEIRRIDKFQVFIGMIIYGIAFPVFKTIGCK